MGNYNITQRAARSSLHWTLDKRAEGWSFSVLTPFGSSRWPCLPEYPWPQGPWGEEMKGMLTPMGTLR